MQKKVGIVSCYFKNNYGSLLQAYATQKVLDDNNIPNETIEISNLEDFKKGKRKYYISQITNFGFIKTKFGMIKLKIQRKTNKELGKNLSIRDKKFKEYKSVFNLTKSYPTYSSLTNAANLKYSDVIVGSDQLWLPVNVVADYYTLNWVPDDVNKISYSTSFGVSKIPDKYKESYKNFLSRINHLSTREESGVKLIKSVAGIDAKLVCDPTILLTKDDWAEHAVKDRIIKDKYIFCYFLGKNIEHRKFVERLKEKTGYKIVSINHSDEYVKYSDTFADIAPYDVGPKEWINLIENAEYVCSDSFHSTVFSILFNKEFFAFRRFSQKNKNNTNSRLDSLLNVAGISTDRILTGTENVDDMTNNKIDYTSVNKNIDEFRKDSKEWLLNSITYKPEDDKDKYIKIEDKEMCTGCTACMNKCPKGAISMKSDEEGFLYPSVDKDKCINCGLCKKVCPVLNSKKDMQKAQKAYVLNNKDIDVRKNSSSGGFFSALANYVINNNGVVFGASYDENFLVRHIYVTSKDKLGKLRESKYLQSDMDKCFLKAENFLKSGKMVCFSGTPCQIEGLKNYLGKDYENLILADVMCHSVPSPKFFKKYLNYITKNFKDKNIQYVSFRNKDKYGYKYSQMVVRSKSDLYSQGVETDPCLRAFFGDLSVRPSCYNCKFKKRYHVSDFTMWDCFIVEKFSKELDDDLGSSRLLVNSQKGKKIFDEIKSGLDYVEVSPDELVKNVQEMLHSVNKPAKREKFFKDMNELDEKNFFKKWFPSTPRVVVEKEIRIFLAKTGLYKNVKKIAKKIIGKKS